MKYSRFPNNPGESITLNFLVLIASLIFISSASAASGSIYTVTDYGAIGDGVTLNTKAIQATIDDCAEKGGGTVYFPAGTFLSGCFRVTVNQIHLQQQYA